MTRLVHMKSAVACAAAAALLAAGVTACSSSSNKSSNGATGAAGGGTLTIQGDSGTPTLVENFNPFQSATELHGTYLIYEPLEFRSPVDGTYTPFLATGYKFTDPKTLVYTIRQNVKWSDGTALTPADVVFTFNLLKKYPALDGNGVWQQISGVTAAGNDVTISFKAANVPFAGVVAQTPIVPEHLWTSISDPTKDANTKPVGTGPFMLDTFAPTQYKLKKNPTYWQASKIAPSEAVFPAQSSNQSTNQLDVTSGKFDWAYTFLPNVKQTYVSRDSTHNIYWFPPGGAITLYLNLTKAPYSDANFRKGVSLSLDRTTVALKAVNGYLQAASQSGPDPAEPEQVAGLEPAQPGCHRPGQVGGHGGVRAGRLHLAGRQAGEGRQAGHDEHRHAEQLLRLVAAAKEVGTELGQAGITVNQDLPQFAQYQSSIQAGSFDAAIGGYGGTGDPYTDFNNALNSSFAAPVNTPTANNFQRFKDPAVDQALATLAAATDPAAQQQATYKLEQVMYNQVPIVLMYYGGSWGLFSTKHFTGWPSASDPYTLPTNYNNSLLAVVTHLTKP